MPSPPGQTCTHIPIGVAVEEYGTDEKLTISPNTFSTGTNIQIPDAVRGGEMFIYNSNGQLVMKMEVKSNSIFISSSGLDAGVYFCRVLEDDKVYRGKFIVEK